jgi:hypothetical protein
LPIVAVFIFTAALASILFWFATNRNQSTALNTPVNEVTETPAPTDIPLPTDTPTPSVAISKALKLQVLNATSINGQAATVKEKLTQLGFTSVAVGNSTEKVTGNVVRYKPSLADQASYFESNLTDSFPATYSDELKESGNYDVVFIIGTDLKTGAVSANDAPPSQSSVTPTKKASATPSVKATLTTKAKTSVTPTPAEE